MNNVSIHGHLLGRVVLGARAAAKGNTSARGPSTTSCSTIIALAILIVTWISSAQTHLMVLKRRCGGESIVLHHSLTSLAVQILSHHPIHCAGLNDLVHGILLCCWRRRRRRDVVLLVVTIILVLVAASTAGRGSIGTDIAVAVCIRASILLGVHGLLRLVSMIVACRVDNVTVFLINIA